MKSADEQLALISVGTAQIEPRAELLQKLRRSVETGVPLRVKYGIDPTGIDVHLGHTVPLRKLRLFQELGHTAVLIIGNSTALVGDPSGRDEARQRLTPEVIEANARDYLTQVSKVIDITKTEVRPNGDWFGKWGFGEMLALMSKITVQRMLERDDFTKRQTAGTPIYLHECLYPLMQGHDSVEIRADVELGGSEQLFSLMLARDLQRDAGQAPQVAVTLPILRGISGDGRRMGKSLNNYVGVGEPAQSQFDKIMSIPDDLMAEWFTLLTDRPGVPEGVEPKEAKLTLAADIVAFYYGAEVAKQSREGWEKRFSRKEDPDEIPEKTIEATQLLGGAMPAAKLLVALGLAATGGEAKRLFGPNSGVTVGPDREKITDPNAPVGVADGLIVRVGSRKIVRAKVI